MKRFQAFQIAVLLCLWSLQAIAQTGPSVIISSDSGLVGQVAPVPTTITYTAEATVVAFQVEFTYDNINLVPDLSFCDPGPGAIGLDFVYCNEFEPGKIRVIVENATGVTPIIDQLQFSIPFDISNAPASPPPYDLTITAEKYVDASAGEITSGGSTSGAITVSEGPQPDWSSVPDSATGFDFGSVTQDTGAYLQNLEVTNVGEATSTLSGSCYMGQPQAPAGALAIASPMMITGDGSLTPPTLGMGEVGTLEVACNSDGMPPGPYTDMFTCEHNGSGILGESSPVTYNMACHIMGVQEIVGFATDLAGPAVIDGTTILSVTEAGLSGQPVVYGVSAGSAGICSIAADVVTFLAAGICTVTADQAGTVDYHPATQVTLDITVNKKEQAITNFASGTPGVVDGTSTLSATSGSSTEPVVFDSSTPLACSVSGTMVTFNTAGVGACTVTANQAGDDEFNDAPEVSLVLDVAKADQTINGLAANPAAGMVDGQSTLSATATSGLAVTFGASTTPTICSVTGSVVTYLAVGTCTIEADQPGDDNYNEATQVTVDVTVAPGDQEITNFYADPEGGGVDDTSTLFATGGNSTSPVIFSSATPDICLVVSNIVTYTDTGTCTVIANQAGDANYNAADPVAIDLPVTDATSIPTLSQWGLIAMFLIMLGLGGMVIRRRDLLN